MSDLKVVSISHSIDPDGLGSQAIIFRYFRELNVEPIGFLGDYHNFIEVFEKALKEKPNVLIISDIGLNSNIIHQIAEPLKELQARKMWIDHHKAPDDLRKMIEDAVDEFIHDRKVCAAELVQKRFMPDDEISKRIAEIGHNGDFDVDERLANVFYTIIDFYRNSMDDLIRVRELLAKGDFESEEIFQEYLEAYKAFEAERDRIRKDLKILKLGGKTVAFAYSKIMPRGKVTKFLSEISKEDILLAVDTTNFRIGLRSDNTDVAAIAGKFGGGGHKHRSGFTYKDALNKNNKVTEDFRNALEDAITEIQ